MKFLLVVYLICMISGCAATSSSPGKSESSSLGVYQLSTKQDGSVYRLNTKTGKVWEVDNGDLKEINEPKPLQLKVGAKYYIENNRSIEYLGDGKFTTPIQDFSRLWE